MSGSIRKTQGRRRAGCSGLVKADTFMHPQTEAHSFTKDLQKGDQLTNRNITTATRAKRDANPHKTG